MADARVSNKWSCHGPVPWPSADFQRARSDWKTALEAIGETLADLLALGLGLPVDRIRNVSPFIWCFHTCTCGPAICGPASLTFQRHNQFQKI
jgi:hypothetical protein